MFAQHVAPVAQSSPLLHDIIAHVTLVDVGHDGEGGGGTVGMGVTVRMPVNPQLDVAHS